MAIIFQTRVHWVGGYAFYSPLHGGCAFGLHHSAPVRNTATGSREDRRLVLVPSSFSAHTISHGTGAPSGLCRLANPGTRPPGWTPGTALSASVDMLPSPEETPTSGTARSYSNPTFPLQNAARLFSKMALFHIPVSSRRAREEGSRFSRS